MGSWLALTVSKPSIEGLMYAHACDAADVMLQASRLSCSCQDATVTFPPDLGDELELPLVGAQATSSTPPMAAIANSLHRPGLVPVIRPPSGCSRSVRAE